MLNNHRLALVLGTGGASKAVVYVLRKLGIDYKLISSSNKGAFAYADIDANLIRQATLIINTTPLGTFPAIDERPPLPYEAVGAGHTLYDLVYNPAVTSFLKAGEERGARIKNGAELLQIQAEESWKIWNQTDKR